MTDVDAHNGGNPHVIVFAPAETLTCRLCGAEYVSRGKNDPGYCRDCERRILSQNAPLVGGTLGGQ